MNPQEDRRVLREYALKATCSDPLKSFIHRILLLVDDTAEFPDFDGGHASAVDTVIHYLAEELR
jgi:hypothetical protein